MKEQHDELDKYAAFSLIQSPDQDQICVTEKIHASLDEIKESFGYVTAIDQTKDGALKEMDANYADNEESTTELRQNRRAKIIQTDDGRQYENRDEVEIEDVASRDV